MAIVSVWFDNISDNRGWIVDVDAEGCGESDTLRVFPATNGGFDSAVEFAKRAGLKRHCDVHICGSASKIVLLAGTYQAD